MRSLADGTVQAPQLDRNGNPIVNALGVQQFFDPVHAGAGEGFGQGFGGDGSGLNGEQLAQDADLVGQGFGPGGAEGSSQ